MITLRSATDLYESVDFGRCKGTDEVIAVARLAPKILSIWEEERRLHESLRQDLLATLDDVDFTMYATFKNYDRRMD